MKRTVIATSLGPICAAMLLGGCANYPSLAVRSPYEQQAVVDSLFFGRSMRDGEVSEREWRTFIAEVVTPRFPKGITFWKADGQWKNSAGPIVKENSYVLLLVHPDSPELEKAVREIIAAYKERFHQEAVLRVHHFARISF